MTATDNINFDEKHLRHMQDQLSTLSKNFNHLRNKAMEKSHAIGADRAAWYETESEVLDAAINKLEMAEAALRKGPLEKAVADGLVKLQGFIAKLKGEVDADLAKLKSAENNQ
ncbi:hypothetical protein E3E12_04795 [Formicincola oecophyllae]|uniref:Uncharacterized protein n=1 Tax=Formicincola oecophyllae TaxID=2558361 RepID=A0A4Y6UB43_9PROT|nr:hypothetical protein [Formicincola oecophyllae]QDH13621.1 hypothetical protein E3E12_04795 [Formicincola oecophyllae]